mgnify:FL=1
MGILVVVALMRPEFCVFAFNRLRRLVVYARGVAKNKAISGLWCDPDAQENRKH